MNKNIIGLLLVVGGVAFYFYNQNRIAKLRAELDAIRNNPLPDRTDLGSWKKIISILLDLGENVYNEFKPGGAFYNNGNTLGDIEIDELIKNLA